MAFAVVYEVFVEGLSSLDGAGTPGFRCVPDLRHALPEAAALPSLHGFGPGVADAPDVAAVARRRRGQSSD